MKLSREEMKMVEEWYVNWISASTTEVFSDNYFVSFDVIKRIRYPETEKKLHKHTIKLTR